MSSTPLTETSTAEYHTALSVSGADSTSAVTQPYTISVSRPTLIRIIAASIVVVATIVAITVAAVLSSSSSSTSSSSGTGGSSSLSTVNEGDACPLAHILTEGPYWVDEKLDRKDITAGEIGLPLNLTLTVYNSTSTGCMLSINSQVDIWHTNADGGKYSDIASEGTKGQTWLRGFQMTDKSGNAAFTTLYPSWYRGRTTHIHVRIRLHDTAGRTTYDQTTQLFFDDNVSGLVFATYPYNKRTGRDTFNRNDGLYRSDLQVTLTGDIKYGYESTFVIGIPMVR